MSDPYEAPMDLMDRDEAGGKSGGNGVLFPPKDARLTPLIVTERYVHTSQRPVQHNARRVRYEL